MTSDDAINMMGGGIAPQAGGPQGGPPKAPAKIEHTFGMKELPEMKFPLPVRLRSVPANHVLVYTDHIRQALHFKKSGCRVLLLPNKAYFYDMTKCHTDFSDFKVEFQNSDYATIDPIVYWRIGQTEAFGDMPDVNKLFAQNNVLNEQKMKETLDEMAKLILQEITTKAKSCADYDEYYKFYQTSNGKLDEWLSDNLRQKIKDQYGIEILDFVMEKAPANSKAVHEGKQQALKAKLEAEAKKAEIEAKKGYLNEEKDLRIQQAGVNASVRMVQEQYNATIEQYINIKRAIEQRGIALSDAQGIEILAQLNPGVPREKIYELYMKTKMSNNGSNVTFGENNFNLPNSGQITINPAGQPVQPTPTNTTTTPTAPVQPNPANNMPNNPLFNGIYPQGYNPNMFNNNTPDPNTNTQGGRTR